MATDRSRRDSDFFGTVGRPEGSTGVRDGANRGEVCQAVARPVRSPSPMSLSPRMGKPTKAISHRSGAVPRRRKSSGLRSTSRTELDHEPGCTSPRFADADFFDGTPASQTTGEPQFTGKVDPNPGSTAITRGLKKGLELGIATRTQLQNALIRHRPSRQAHLPLGRAWQPIDLDTATRLRAARPFGVKAPQPSLRTGRACGDAGSAFDYGHD